MESKKNELLLKLEIILLVSLCSLSGCNFSQKNETKNHDHPSKSAEIKKNPHNLLKRTKKTGYSEKQKRIANDLPKIFANSRWKEKTQTIDEVGGGVGSAPQRKTCVLDLKNTSQEDLDLEMEVSLLDQNQQEIKRINLATFQWKCGAEHHFEFVNDREFSYLKPHFKIKDPATTDQVLSYDLPQAQKFIYSKDLAYEINAIIDQIVMYEGDTECSVDLTNNTGFDLERFQLGIIEYDDRNQELAKTDITKGELMWAKGATEHFEFKLTANSVRFQFNYSYFADPENNKKIDV